MKNIPPTKNPNPQGKGLVPVLQEISSRQSSAFAIQSKNLASTLHDYALSRLILCADFSFKPVINTPYFLYVKNDKLKLSLISPKEWRDERFGLYICRCTLEDSMLWRVADNNDDPRVAQHFLSAFDSLKDSLLSDLFQEDPLNSTLPYFDERLPFHRRVLANALATHLSRTIPSALSKSFLQLGKENPQSGAALPFLH